MNAKKVTGEKAVEYIKDQMVVGLGTGSTAYYAIKKTGELVRDGLDIKVVPTSKETAELAEAENIPLVKLSDVKRLDLTIDGADEVDSKFNLIKGGGGALLREKIVASASEKLIIIVDDSKMTNFLGDFPLPVEITPFSWEYTQDKIETLNCKSNLRRNEGKIFITDNNNYILDCEFGKIKDPESLTRKLNQIPGVVENGLFVNMAEIVIVGYEDGEVIELKKENSPK